MDTWFYGYMLVLSWIQAVPAPSPAGSSGGEAIRFGDIGGRSDGYSTQPETYLVDKVPEGVLYKVGMHFGTTDPVYVMLWTRVPQKDGIFALTHIKKVESQRTDQNEYVYLNDPYDNCPLITGDDTYLGLWAYNGLPIPYTNKEGFSMREDMWDNPDPPPTKTERKFELKQLNYRFRVEGYVFLRQGSDGTRCPTNEELNPPTLPPATTTTTTTTTTKPPTPPPTTAQPPTPRQTTTTPRPTPAPTTDNAGGTSDMTTTSLSGENQPKKDNTVIYIAAGVIAGIVLVVINVIVCCVIVRKRKAASRNAAGSKPYVAENPAFVMSPETVTSSVYERPLVRDESAPGVYTGLPNSGQYEEIPDRLVTGKTRARVLPSLPPGHRLYENETDDKPGDGGEYMEPTPYVDMSGRQRSTDDNSHHNGLGDSEHHNVPGDQSGSDYLELLADGSVPDSR